MTSAARFSTRYSALFVPVVIGGHRRLHVRDLGMEKPITLYSSWKTSIECVISHLRKVPTSSGPFAGEYISSLSGDFTGSRSFHLKEK